MENQFYESDVGEKWGISDNFTNVRISLLDGKSQFLQRALYSIRREYLL